MQCKCDIWTTSFVSLCYVYWFIFFDRMSMIYFSTSCNTFTKGLIVCFVVTFLWPIMHASKLWSCPLCLFYLCCIYCCALPPLPLLITLPMTSVSVTLVDVHLSHPLHVRPTYLWDKDAYTSRTVGSYPKLVNRAFVFWPMCINKPYNCKLDYCT